MIWALLHTEPKRAALGTSHNVVGTHSQALEPGLGARGSSGSTAAASSSDVALSRRQQHRATDARIRRCAQVFHGGAASRLQPRRDGLPTSSRLRDAAQHSTLYGTLLPPPWTPVHKAAKQSANLQPLPPPHPNKPKRQATTTGTPASTSRTRAWAWRRPPSGSMPPARRSAGSCGSGCFTWCTTTGSTRWWGSETLMIHFSDLDGCCGAWQGLNSRRCSSSEQ